MLEPIELNVPIRLELIRGLYLAGDIPEDSRRKPNYVIAVPYINRQLLVLLFTLTYKLEDLRLPSLDYQRSGFRNLREEIINFKDLFGNDPEWKLNFDNTTGMLVEMEKMYKITPEQKADLNFIDFWPAPFKLLKRARTKTMPCARFLEYLENE